MNITDPIADMLTRIRNSNQLKKDEIVLPFSKIKFEIAKILEKEGYVKEVEELGGEDGKKLRIVIKYGPAKQRVIQNLKRISKPGRRVYVNSKKIHNVLNGMGMAIISTSRGLMTAKEARKRKVGGEIICEIY